MTCVMKEPLHASNQTSSLRILVGDDQADVLEALRLLLKGAGYQSELVDSPQALLRAARSKPFDLILMDLNYARDTTSGAEGLDLLSSLQEQDNAAPVIVMTAWSNVELAVEAMRRGACDFVQKPWDNARLLGAIRKQAGESLERVRTERRVKSELEIAQRSAEVVSKSDSPPGKHRLCGSVCAGTRGKRGLLRFSRHRRQWPGICARRCVGQRRGRGPAHGKSTGVLPQPIARVDFATGADAAFGEQAVLRIHSGGALRYAILRNLRRPHASFALRQLRTLTSILAASQRNAGAIAFHRHRSRNIQQLDLRGAYGGSALGRHAGSFFRWSNRSWH